MNCSRNPPSRMASIGSKFDCLAVAILEPRPYPARFHTAHSDCSVFCKDTIECSVQQDRDDEISEEAEDQAGGNASTASQSGKLNLEQAIEKEANTCADQASGHDCRKPDEHIVNHNPRRDAIGDIGRQ